MARKDPKKYRLNNKLRAIEFLGGKCSVCSYKGCPAVFDFHHIDPKKKTFRISTGLDCSWETLLQEVCKCQLLCANCHRVLHWNKDRNHE